MQGSAFYPGVLYPLLRVPFFIALVTTRVDIRRLLFFPILVLSFFIARYTADNTYSDFVKGISLGTFVFGASDFLLLCSDVQEDIRFEDQKGGMRSRPLMERIFWANRLSLNLRGVGTNIEPTTHLPPRPSRTESRKTFILKQLAWVALYGPLWYMVVEFNKWNPRFTEEPSLLNVPRGGYPWWWRITVWGTMVDIYFSMTTLHCIFSIVMVGLRFSKPHEWPPMFGSPLEAYTVRRYWGNMWHQTYRRFLTVHANYAVHVLRLPPKSKFTTYFKLFLSFFMSGFIHFIGDYMYTSTLFGGAITYFVLNACVITIEDIVIALGKRAGLKGSWKWRIVGYAWVVLIFTILLPGWNEPRLAILARVHAAKAA